MKSALATLSSRLGLPQPAVIRLALFHLGHALNVPLAPPQARRESSLRQRLRARAQATPPDRTLQQP